MAFLVADTADHGLGTVPQIMALTAARALGRLFAVFHHMAFLVASAALHRSGIWAVFAHVTLFAAAVALARENARIGAVGLVVAKRRMPR